MPRVEAVVGQPLRNVVVHAGRADPVALADEEYPAWMWAMVRDTGKASPEPGPADAPTRTALRAATKAKIKANNTLAGRR